MEQQLWYTRRFHKNYPGFHEFHCRYSWLPQHDFIHVTWKKTKHWCIVVPLASPAGDRAALGHPGHRGLGQWAAVCWSLAWRLPLCPPLHRGFMFFRCPPRRTGPLILPEHPQPAGQTVRQSHEPAAEKYTCEYILERPTQHKKILKEIKWHQVEILKASKKA